jgi:hypothetical protein
MKTAFGIAVFCLSIAAAPVQAQLLPSLALVVDSNGKLVGPLVGTDGAANNVVAFTIKGKFFTLNVNQHHLWGNGFGGGSVPVEYVFFASSDCSGTAYIPFSGAPIDDSLMPRTSVVKSTVYRAQPGALPQVIQTNSVNFGDGNGCFGTPDYGELTVLPVEAIVDLAPLFTPPFKIR